MNYKVLYRKYRPIDFDNIIGQEYIITTLKNSVINKNISHAYIFSGPRGTGKTSTAKVFSKSINCLNNENGSPCGKCDFCSNFGENPDIIEIDAASNNGVDEIRNLIDNIKLTPTNGNYKVYIIDEVHMLTTSAFNALLLTLEEPPKHVIFILATTNIESVPITILSRCQRYDFQKIKVEDIVKRLKTICEIEKIDIEEEALTEIAYLSEGGLRDALSLLDQISKNNTKITLELVEKQIRIISQKSINDLFLCIEENNIDLFFQYMNEYKKISLDYKSFIKKMIDVASKNAKNIKMNHRYKRLDFAMYKKLIFDLSECLTKINVNVNPYTMLEIILLEYFDIDEFEKEEDKKIEPVKNQVNPKNETETNTEVVAVDDGFIKIRINNCFVNAQKKHLEEMKRTLTLVNNSNISGKIRSILSDANLVAASLEYLIFTCESEHLSEMANKMSEKIENEIIKVYQNNIKVVFVTTKRWEKEKETYINNLKNNVKYEFIAENTQKSTKSDTIINDIFDINKVEII